MKFLKERAELLAKLRAFFVSRGFTEVSTPSVDPEIIPEAHIDPYEVPRLGWLQASPEMHLKRLLCAGSGPIFEVAKCFRRGERGRLHRPEFTMVEWYRPGDDMQAGMILLDELLQHLLNCRPARRTSYREAFERALAIDPYNATIEELQELVGEAIESRDELLNWLLAKHVDSMLGVEVPELLYHYPAGQSSLSAIITDQQGVCVAERFELYYQGMELANGYHELTNPVELRERFETANAIRITGGRPALPLPEKLLAAMTSPGLPPSSGVALGFERVVMLAVGAESIDEVVV